MAEYNTMELMIVVAARNLENGKTVGVGTGAPCAAAMLAQKTHAPDLVIMFEAGGDFSPASHHAHLRRRLAHLLPGGDGQRNVRDHGDLPERNG